MTRALLVALALGGCAPVLTAESAAPPGRTARLDEVRGFFDHIKSYRLELSQGAALAVSCSRGGPCEHMTATSDNAAIADVRPASLGVLRASSVTNAQTAAAFVVIGKAPGTTTVHLRATGGDRTIAVTIVPPPGAAPPTARAAR